MKKTVFFAILFFCVICLHGQDGFSLVKGRIVSEDSLQPVSNAHIISKTSLYGAIADADGNFSLMLKKTDTLWVSCVGFEDGNIIVNRDDVFNKELIIRMKRAVVILDEVNVFPYLDRAAINEIIAKMPIKQPFAIPHVTKTVDPRILNRKPVKQPPASIINPVSLIYKHFNKNERLKRKMLRNRKRYNKTLIEQGAPDSLLLPEVIDFSDYNY
ncbi:MAG: carboxypeptidase-like regulatory domain-containing protein [Bacteroidales bacterium]|nr:carboxypeptidase-like regulatory domain-containing protein [Bacteroidales bacterium]